MRQENRLAKQGPRKTASALLRAVISGMLAMTGVCAMAQQAQPPADALVAQNPTSAAVAENNAADAIPEIVVTAQFRAQNLQDTPIAITAITGDMLRARNQTDIAAVAERAPGVQLTTGGLGGASVTTLSIRGIGQADFNLASDPGVGMYIDDVYYGTLYGSLLDLIDLDRVEILRGPQGTLSGKNSEGGSVKLYSRQPGPDNDGYLEGIVGTFNRREIRAGTNFTLVPDHLFVRVTGIGEHIDGYVKDFDYQCATGKAPVGYNSPASMALAPNGVAPDGCQLGTSGGKQVVAVRTAAKLVVNDQITDTLTYDDLIDHSDPAPVVLTSQGPWHGPGYTDPGAPPNDFTQNFSTPPGSYYNYSSFCGLAGTPYLYCANPTNKVSAWGVSNLLNVDFGHGYNLTSITSERSLESTSVADGDGSPMSRLMNVWTVQYKQYSEELRLNGTIADQWRWTVGGYYFQYRAQQGGRISLDGAADQLATFDFIFNNPIYNTSRSGFAHLEYQPIEPLTLTLGGRYTKDHKEFGYYYERAPGYPGTFLDGSVLPLTGTPPAEFNGNHTDYSVTADYKFTHDISVYVSTGTGYKGGGLNPRPYYALQAQPFGPETVTSYEVGLKSFLWDRNVRMNISAYNNIYHKIQLTLNQCPQFVPPGLPPNCAMPANVGDATIKGLEFESEVHPIANAVIDFSASYTDFKYTRVDPATGIGLDFKPPLVPNFKAAIGAQYRVELGDRLGTITPRLDFNYIARQQQATVNVPQSWNPGYGLLNGRISWALPSGDTTISLEGNNLLDKYYGIVRTYSYPPAGTGNDSTIDPGPPRMVAISLRRTF